MTKYWLSLGVLTLIWTAIVVLALQNTWASP